MSENEGHRTDDAPVPQTNPGPRVDPVSTDDDIEGRANPGPREVPEPEDPDADTDEQAIPGEHPKDDPDLEGEERFDAG
ncbi:hypothetical protein [Promicromonospora iranensis]|uniref:Uncharacterized protein n=1 Tax=Promicromonospora iranensis TaxID=1105144 RepID=A0ABU2CNG7_9MICO|nr:hypothetical protein [Promicromonospora iranensis]MDR7382869.1 hypothetical protein [Promicromonospora iranensis]